MKSQTLRFVFLNNKVLGLGLAKARFFDDLTYIDTFLRTYVIGNRLITSSSHIDSPLALY